MISSKNKSAQHKPYAQKNANGYWVGCIEYPCGVHARVTSAQYTEGAALAIAQRLADGADALAAIRSGSSGNVAGAVQVAT